MTESASPPRADPEMEVSVLQDLNALAQIAANPVPTAGIVRQSSALARRLLIYRDLFTVANGRVGRLMLPAPQNQMLYAATRSKHCVLFLSGGAETHGISVRGVMAHDPGTPPSRVEMNPGEQVLLKADSWLGQRVIYYRDAARAGADPWATRADVVKYMANIAHGVHADEPKSLSEDILAKVRAFISFSPGGITFHQDRLRQPTADFVFRPGALDPVAMEYVTALGLLAGAPMVKQLIHDLEQEYPGA